MKMQVIDAENAVLGRLASEVAKMLMKGEKVIVVNAEKAIIGGSRDYIFQKYKQRVDRADRANPRRGPKFPRRPDLLLKRTVRGMLPKTNRGRNILRNLKVYMGIPPEYDGKTTKLNIRMPKGDFVTLEELGEFLGWKNPIKG